MFHEKKFDDVVEIVQEVGDPKGRYWVGLVKKDNVWQWTDGTSLIDQDKWDEGQPAEGDWEENAFLFKG